MKSQRPFLRRAFNGQHLTSRSNTFHQKTKVNNPFYESTSMVAIRYGTSGPRPKWQCKSLGPLKHLGDESLRENITISWLHWCCLETVAYRTDWTVFHVAKDLNCDENVLIVHTSDSIGVSKLPPVVMGDDVRLPPLPAAAERRGVARVPQ